MNCIYQRQSFAPRFVLVRTVLLLASALLATAASADILDGRVVGVSDGDTIKVLDAQSVQHVIRVSGIDAPEKKMPFSQRSMQNLSDLVFGKKVTVEGDKFDLYGRFIGEVLVSKGEINLSQVQAGFAWHYKQYQREQTPDDRRTYAEAEDQARLGRLGLWADGNPVPPWTWRTMQRTQCHRNQNCAATRSSAPQSGSGAPFLGRSEDRAARYFG